MFDFGTMFYCIEMASTRCFVAGKFVRLWVKFTVKETTL